jgi:hypothetical protein
MINFKSKNIVSITILTIICGSSSKWHVAKKKKKKSNKN